MQPERKALAKLRIEQAEHVCVQQMHCLLLGIYVVR